MRLFFFLIIVISNLSHSYENNQLLLHNQPKKIGYIEFKTLKGNTVNFFKKNKNPYALLTGNRCPPCIKEIPQLIGNKKNVPDQVNLIFISMDLNASVVIPRFLKKNNLSFDEFIKIAEIIKVDWLNEDVLIELNELL